MVLPVSRAPWVSTSANRSKHLPSRLSKRRLSRLRLRHLSKRRLPTKAARRTSRPSPGGPLAAANRTSRRAQPGENHGAPRHFRNVKERDEDEHYRCTGQTTPRHDRRWHDGIVKPRSPRTNGNLEEAVGLAAQEGHFQGRQEVGPHRPLKA